MTWLYVPRPSYQSAPEPEDLTSGLNWRAQLLASSVTWNGKPSRSPTWLRRFNTVSWMTPLFGAICEPFEASRGVARWIGLLAASRANPTAPRENASAPATTGTSGPTPPESSKKSDPAASSWRTFQESQGITTSASGQSYEAWVTGLRKDYSRRLRSARRRLESDCLSWRTPAAMDGEGGVLRPRENQDMTKMLAYSLRDQAGNWPTPTTAPEAPNPKSNTTNGPRNLLEVTEGLWLTPVARNSVSDTGEWTGRFYRRESGTKAYSHLSHQVEMWPTPLDNDSRDHMTFGGGYLKLAGAARQWPTAKATDGEKEPGAHRQGDPSLPSAARLFPTPTVTSKNGFDGPNKKNPSRDWEVYSRLARMTSKPGHECSPKCRRLNPLFVEKLMGWPGGWTLLPLGLNGSPSLATEWSRWWRLMRSELSRLDSAPGRGVNGELE